MLRREAQPEAVRRAGSFPNLRSGVVMTTLATLAMLKAAHQNQEP